MGLNYLSLSNISLSLIFYKVKNEIEIIILIVVVSAIRKINERLSSLSKHSPFLLFPNIPD